ncbi:MAG: sn-glycerol-1-phosphate dehydrogenase [Chloroflexi bacterium]|nr:MAG: sn-glycerol-1-phosphate dehydrogenase [Chloroflexota bacterium]
MQPDVHIYIGRDAVEHLLTYCKSLPSTRFTLVSDTNTYSALGERIEAALAGAGLAITNVILQGDEVVADEKYLMQLLIQAPTGDQVFVGIGSGTITDITRYIAFRTRNTFISAPTAASVDGFLSIGAPLVVGGIKDTYKAQGPIAAFADLDTLVAAPHRLTAAGFGDVMGKTTALADWRLGQLLWDEPFDQTIDRRVRSAMANCFEAADDIASGTERGVRYLIEALVETGLCMLDMGDSRPASGSEHHCSHYWEMQLLKANRPAILHGVKVGYATSLIAQLYDKLRNLTQDEIRRLVQDARFSGHAAEIAEIRHAYGPAAEQVLRIQEPFLKMTEEEHDHLQQRIVENWPVIQEIAQTVLPSSTILDLLHQVGAPTDWKTLGLDEAMVEPALRYGHYLRNRFTVIKLCIMLGIDVRPDIPR